MKANVQCVGDGDHVEHRRSVIDDREDIAHGVPCGWRGYRKPIGDTSPYVYLGKRCPHCGGRVDLTRPGPHVGSGGGS